MKVLLRTPMSKYSGYGNDGIGLAQALMRWGADVYLQATAIDAPLPQDVANLFTKELKSPFDLYINHIDPGQLYCPAENAVHVDLKIAWTMWECSNYDNAPKKSRKSLKKHLKYFDAFVGYSDVDPDCFRPYYKGPLFVQQGGFDPTSWPELERDWDSKEFYFCMLGALGERKDPWRAIDAFRQAKAIDPEFDRWARLSLKTVSPGLHHKIEDLFRQTDPETGEEYTSLRIFYDIWPTEVIREFYKVQHVMITPSRGEGKNVPALEFMSTGGTVIATDWAGHKQWLDPAYSYPLDYTLEPVNSDNPGTLNARASVEQLTELMLHTFHNRLEVKEKGKLAAQVIPAAHSWDAVVEKLFLKLRDNVPTGGERLWTLAQMARRNGIHEDS